MGRVSPGRRISYRQALRKERATKLETGHSAYMPEGTLQQRQSLLGRVDGFDQDEAESKRDERAVILRRHLASKCDTLKRLSLPTACSMRARAL
jgi:hypothetical protein